VSSAEDDTRSSLERHVVSNQRAVDVADCVITRRHCHRVYVITVVIDNINISNIVSTLKSSFENLNINPFSALTLLVGRQQGTRPVKYTEGPRDPV